MRQVAALTVEQELGGGQEEALRAFLHSVLVDLHTAMPGMVVAFDADKQTAEVQPAIRRLLVSGTKIVLPPCLDVPVCFYGSALSFPVATGDDCVLVFSERCIDRWYEGGGVQDPADFRMHDLSDGFALLGFNSLPRKLVNLRTDGPELRTRDGSNRVALAGGQVFLGTAQKTQALSLVELPVVTNGVVLAEAIDTLTELPRFLLGGTSLNVMAKK